jgi:hypothetical protein
MSARSGQHGSGAITTRPAQREPAAWVTAARENLSGLTVEQHFRLAEACRPASLRERGLRFRDLVLRPVDDIIRLLDAHWPGGITDKGRALRYAAHAFAPRLVPTEALRLWPGADGLPRHLTDWLHLRELGELVARNGLPQFPNGRGLRLSGLYTAVTGTETADEVLDEIGVIAPIVLPEFHPFDRPACTDSPLTIDDGNARAFAQAVRGQEYLYCLVGEER